MAGVFFDKDNIEGYLETNQYSPFGFHVGVPYFSHNGYRHKIWMLLERGEGSDNSPLVNIVTNEGNTALYVRLTDGKLDCKIQIYNNPSRYFQFTTVDPLPLDELIEIAAIFDYPGKYADNGNLKIYINGTSVAVTTAGYYPSTSNTIFDTCIKVDIGRGDATIDVAKNVFIKDLAILPEAVSGSPAPDNFQLSIGKWQGDFSSSDDLKLVCSRTNYDGDAPLTLINSGVSWIEGNGLPDDTGGAGGIIIPGNGNTTTIQGTVTEDGIPVSRRVFAITQSLLEVAGSEQTRHAVLDSTLSDPATGDYALDTSPYEGEVLVLAMDNYGQPWQPDTDYQVGDVIRPVQFQGYIYICTIAGTGDSTEPQWWFDTENNQAIGTAQFKAKPYTRPLAHGPLLPEIIPS
ncbi:hypothetical protein [Endozoicomonas sp. Mp262]|uniref:hypothetical protein n=1 Tax=Endozoicomonas sp. Mp262 TaxID=2919499 RepID=UPI0021D91132